MRRMATGWVVLVLLAAAAWGQKKVQVKLSHPARMAQAVAGRRLLLGVATGPCSKDWFAMVEPDLLGAGFLFEPERGVDVRKAAEMAPKLGSAALLSFEVTRCETRRREPLLGSGLPAPHISRIEGRFEGRLRILDAETGQELQSLGFKAEASKENTSETGNPEYPDADEVLKLTVAKGVGAVRPVYRPWTEMREVPLHDAKECGMKETFELVKAGRYGEALGKARAELEACPAKQAPAAWYNLGLVTWLQPDAQGAVKAWEEAARLSAKAVPAELLAEVKREVVQP